ncbi:hypothetical protein AALP_AA6G283200 [Arabis alpina]|uniref:Cyclin-dependent kinase inhibitor n=1 Tax=Arabis alpina TaxID=50452 RepID=A0A087GS92_ARAAL|nr:hypothetical protein AALP_AA6G283200 [Arabis alpina]
MVRKYRKAKGTMVESGVSSTYMQLRSRRIVYFTVDCRSENPTSVADNGVSSSSCCSTTTKSSKNVVVGEFIDLEEERDGETETSTYRKSTKRKLFENLIDKEPTKSMENHHSPEIATDLKELPDCCCSGRTSSSTMEEKAKTSITEQPTVAEIDEFFAEAEKQLQTKFTKKYNFDFEKEKPLEGRYQWVKVSEEE